MIDQWREFLYPLGFLSAMAFSGRMLLQWMSSEMKGHSVVMPGFWKLSLVGNVLLAIHAFIQLQFHVCLVQVCNGVISWRNLNLMQPSKKQFSTRLSLKIMAIAILMVFALFSLQGYISSEQIWFRVPLTPWQDHAAPDISWKWHAIGTLGLVLFGSRFWIQWWFAEQHQTSYLGRAFWWTSLIGEVLCLIYFVQIKDPVNFIGPAFGLIPYIRNLMLISKKTPSHSEG